MTSEQDENYLNFNGLKIIWAKIKSVFATKAEVDKKADKDDIDKLKPLIYAGL